VEEEAKEKPVFPCHSVQAAGPSPEEGVEMGVGRGGQWQSVPFKIREDGSFF
jgi:hypothetical protein